MTVDTTSMSKQKRRVSEQSFHGRSNKRLRPSWEHQPIHVSPLLSNDVAYSDLERHSRNNAVKRLRVYDKREYLTLLGLTKARQMQGFELDHIIIDSRIKIPSPEMISTIIDELYANLKMEAHQQSSCNSKCMPVLLLQCGQNDETVHTSDSSIYDDMPSLEKDNGDTNDSCLTQLDLPAEKQPNTTINNLSAQNTVNTDKIKELEKEITLLKATLNGTLVQNAGLVVAVEKLNEAVKIKQDELYNLANINGLLENRMKQYADDMLTYARIMNDQTQKLQIRDNEILTLREKMSCKTNI